MSRLMDPKLEGRYPFEYVNHSATDVRKTIAKELRRLAELKAAQEADQSKVRKIKQEAK